LLRDGAGSAAQGKENGAPVFNLITSAETSDDIIKLNDNIRSDFRYSTKPNELLAPLGVERSYGGFYHIIDPYPPRYNRVALTATAHASGVYTVADSTGVEIGDVLVVTKLDRLGRNAMDVRSTVERLAALGVRVHCLALGGSDLTSPAGKMIMAVIAAMAEFERDLLIERTQSGLTRAKSQGKKLGRPQSLGEAAAKAVLSQLAQGVTVAALARDYGTSRQSIMRIRQARADTVDP
jgi:hypothetical protein